MEAISPYVLAYLLNALWQAPLILGVAWLAETLAGRLRMSERHWLWTVCLVVIVLLPACSLHSPVTIEPQVVFGEPNLEDAAGTEQKAGVFEIKTLAAPPGIAVTVTVGYMLWLLWSAGRLLAGCIGIRRIAHRARRAPWPESLIEAEEAARAATGLLPAPILCSEHGSAPLTAGCREPFIVLPRAIFYSSDRAMLRAVLGHEMAHIARCDYIRKIFLEILAMPLSFHPAMWFVKRRLDRTREMACDEFVARSLVPPRAYARCMLEVARTAAMFRNPEHSLGVLDAGILEERIRLLLFPRRTWGGWARPLVLAAATGLVAAAALALAPAALGVATSAALEGRVFDVSGAVVPGARVLLTDNRTGARFDRESDDAGGFGFRALPAGQYTLAVQKRGFRVFRHRRINLGRTLRINPVLELGTVRETLTVAARIPD